jgi:DNA-binding XRE family transcriptional regulator
MRKTPKIPRILKINDINGFMVTCMFNNGESRLIDFEKLFSIWKVTEKDTEYVLLKPKEFRQVTLRNFTLSWANVPIALENEDGKMINHPYEIDPVTLFENSSRFEQDEPFRFGSIIRSARKKAGMTQEQLAFKSGTSRFYISRLENNKSDIELSTFRKIVEAGLGKHLRLVIE